MDSDSSAPSTSRPDNAPTRWPANRGLPRIAGSELPAAYELARERMGKARGLARGYRVFWVCDGEVGWTDLPAGGSYAILGRHTQCDVSLDRDPEISLRHLLATTVELADGLALRLIDLQTDVPFYLQDDVPRRSIVASGPVVARVGRYVVGGVPIDDDRDVALAPNEGGALAPPIIRESTSLPVSAAAALAPDEPASAPLSRITVMPASAPIVTLAPGRTTASIILPSGLPDVRPVRGGAARVTLHRAGRGASVDLTEAELDAGVLIGRSHRCRDDGLHAVLDTNISRGHLLVLRHHGGVEAFDLCSTQGTYHRGRNVRRVALTDEGASFRLAVTNAVTFEWHPRHAAS